MSGQSIVEGLAILVFIGLVAYGWSQERQKRIERDKALDYKNQLETMEAIERLKIKAETDAQAADEVNKAWDSSSS